MTLASAFDPALIGETIGRTALVYVAVLAALRIAGKRHVAQLSIVDFVLVLLVSNAVQSAMVGSDTSLAGGLVAAVTLIGLNVALTRLVARSPRLGAILSGEPTLLVRDGKVLEAPLASEGIRREELEAAIREHGFDDVSQVRHAILETDGSLSVVGLGEPTPERRLPPLARHRRPGRRGGAPSG